MHPEKKPRHLFYLVLVIFILPMILSTLLFHYHDYFHFKTVNHGKLLNPPLNVSYLFSGNPHKNKWHILHVAANCDEKCQKINFELSQVCKALGKDQDRMESLFLKENDPLLKIMSTKLEENHIAVGDKIYLIDPEGNLFMYYSSNNSPMDILRDIKRVLEVSQIG